MPKSWRRQIQFRWNLFEMFPRHKRQGWNLFPIKQPHNIPDKYLPYKNIDTMTRLHFFMTQTSCLSFLLRSMTNRMWSVSITSSGWKHDYNYQNKVINGLLQIPLCFMITHFICLFILKPCGTNTLGLHYSTSVIFKAQNISLWALTTS